MPAKRYFIAIILGVCMSLTFLYADEKDINFRPLFQRMPKAELHLHLGGAYPLEYLTTIASEEQIGALQNYLDKISKGMTYQEAFNVFGVVKYRRKS